MEASLQLQRPLSFGNTATDSKIRPLSGDSSNGRRFCISSLSSPGCKAFPGVRVESLITASTDYSRRQQRRGPNARPTPRGFVPRTQEGTSTQKKDQSDSGKREISGLISSEYTDPGNRLTEMKADSSENKKNEVIQESSLLSSQLKTKTEMPGEANEKRVEIEECFPTMESPGTTEKANLPMTEEHKPKLDEPEILEKSYIAVTRKTVINEGEMEADEEITESGELRISSEIVGNDPVGERVEIKEHFPTMKSPDTTEKANLSMTEEHKPKLDEPEILEKSHIAVTRKTVINDGEMEADEEITESGALRISSEIVGIDPVSESDSAEVKNTAVKIGNGITELGQHGKLEKTDVAVGKEPDMEALTKQKLEMKARAQEALMKQKQEMEARAQEALMKQKQEMEACARKQLLEVLAEENFSTGNKVFVFPKVLKADQSIEVFLNRSISTLKGEPDVLIMGAFNDWRWKSFTKEMQKTDLKGDWWSCQVDIPKEAYKMDFVFFNGGDIYDNNNSKDFFLPVESGMDGFAFEDFLLEEKRRELERLAAEEAERERQAEEQRRLEAEKAASEADRAQAKTEVENRREILHQVMKKAVPSVDNVWYIEPSQFKGEDMVKLYYNRSSGPLAEAKGIWIHGGSDNWKDGLTIVGSLVQAEKKAGDWWYVDVVVPNRSQILDWVFADGPPGSARLYDNNNFQDFHTTVPKRIPEELYWFEEEQKIYRRLQEERRQREEAIRAKAERTARMKAETKEKTMKTFLMSQKHIVYTEPLEVYAGSTITVFYNPSNTVLNGKPEVWFKCSFNRWTHRKGPLPPQKMLPADNGSHVKATVKVPLDAYMIDFVFSEKEDGGIYDNKNGTDYHIPVVGGISKAPPMHIVHVAVEMAPIAKVGGLGDVVTSLSRAVQDLGHNVDIILPKYDCMNLSNVKDFQFHRSFFWVGTEVKVWHGKVEGLSVYFVEPQNGLFWTGCVYGRSNDGERFSFFCHAALEFLLQSGFHPDILHCHDWSSAPVAWLFKDHYMHYGLSNARVVFTIHNLEFGANQIGKAMAYSDKSTTVSPNYAREVSGNSIIAPHLHKFHGILNGIDPDIWDPYNDYFIPMDYTSENVVEGKRAAKIALQQRLGLRTSDHPVVGVITRLTHQKGIHLIKHAIWQTLERNGQVVLLGSAPDPRIQNDFVNLANHLHSTHGDCARLCLTYDEPLSHLIYAGSDFILVPSMFEPCGLTQLTAMRYGSIPVVRKTGGLYDTVFDVDHDQERAQALGLEPNGFSFDGADNSGVDYALNRAISAWYDGREWFNSLCKRVMEQDWSWNRPALDYMELYYAARK